MTEASLLERPQAADDPGAKQRQIFDGARRVFFDSGFDGASMNEIARSAGVSKGTLYVYFASKEALFAALVRHDKRAQVEQFCLVDPEHGDMRRALIEAGTLLLIQMLTPDRIAQMRMTVAASAKFPEIGRAFYESGPEYGRSMLARYLEENAAAHGLEIPNYLLAAEHLVELCKSHILLRAILNVGDRPSDAELRAHVTESIDRFLRAYRAD